MLWIEKIQAPLAYALKNYFNYFRCNPKISVATLQSPVYENVWSAILWMLLIENKLFMNNNKLIIDKCSFFRLSLSNHKEPKEKILKGSSVGGWIKNLGFVARPWLDTRGSQDLARLSDITTVTRLVKEDPGSSSRPCPSSGVLPPTSSLCLYEVYGGISENIAILVGK